MCQSTGSLKTDARLESKEMGNRLYCLIENACGTRYLIARMRKNRTAIPT
jgi:hypothetical protein